MLHTVRTLGRIMLFVLLSVAAIPTVLTGQASGSSLHDLAGTWVGRMTHPSDGYTQEWAITLTLEQNASRVTGTTRLDFQERFAVFALTGTARGRTLTATEGAILEQDAVSAPWCTGRTLHLEQVSPDRLRGRWRSATPGCSGGEVVVERCHDPRSRAADRSRAERLARAAGHMGDAARTFVTEYIKLQEAHRYLEQSRELFTRSHDFVHAFGALYSHTISLTLDRFDRGMATSPDELVLANAFYDAWAYNLQRYTTGGSLAVEPHWQVYFTLASIHGPSLYNNKSATPEFAALVTAGIRAHIDGDLPRSIRHVLSRLPADRQRALAADFRASDPIFETARSRFLDDVATSIYPSVYRWKLNFGTSVLRSFADPVSMRAGAWRAGANRRAELATGRLEQPSYSVARACTRILPSS